MISRGIVKKQLIITLNRVQTGLMKRPCEHLLEIGLKFDERAYNIIAQGLGREITSEEAGQIYQTNSGWVLKTTLTFMTLYHF